MSTLEKPAPRADLPAARFRATSYDVAKRAGVSQSAVSRCFRQGASIAPATKIKIMEAARELGYRPNAIASGLITKRSNMVAVLISTQARLYYPEVLAQLTQTLSAQDMRVLLFDLKTEGDVEAALQQVWRYWVDGAIVAAHLTAAQIRAFDDHHVPIVLYNRSGEGEVVSSVFCDSVAGERVLLDALLSAGHRHFGIITGPNDSYTGRQRVETAKLLINEAGFGPPLVAEGTFDYGSGTRGLHQLMEASGGKLDAVVCANDLMAIGAIDAARLEMGLKVPDDLSIVGFDGAGAASWIGYQVTTIQQPVERMCRAAVAMLMERIEAPETASEVRTFPGKFIPGTSARIA
ncbi:LacI family DNA-binding transcriptional regulator [Sphingomonas bacterium]|uniref:LacI family DNA-binding transcriptional regulator n=1 Tax=Sphingomonas bacterium TaxID=1895847 RepID=UPI0015760B31|nr:LacI family DNA-binding transcriptional regulator [Sphingomonas bacterium]